MFPIWADPEQPVAGPSSRPYNFTAAQGNACAFTTPAAKRAVYRERVTSSCDGQACCVLSSAQDRRRRPEQEDLRRQAPSTSTISIGSSSSAMSSSSSSSSSNGLFVGPSTSSTSTSIATLSSTTTISPPASSTTTTSLAPVAVTTGRRASTSLYSVTRTSAAPSSTVTQYTPGVLFNLTLTGERDDEAIYGVRMSFGHGGYLGAKRSTGGGSPGIRDKGKRRATTKWDGTSLQNMTLQVDLGSSDLWVATTGCQTSDCNAAPALFDTSASIDSGVPANMTYQRGDIDGDVMWEELQLGPFGIGYQAFIGATNVQSEGLGTGQFSGLLGLSLPANSVILELIPGTTSNNPDGATFLDNLFGSGALAPSQRLFSLSLARREDVRTRSVLGIGTTANDLCAAPCNLTGIPIVAQPNLGVTGFLHWRIPLSGLSALKFGNPQTGTNMTATNITLGPSNAVSGRAQTVAVLDSGGVAILASSKTYTDAIYAAFGVTASADGLYRLPCTQPISLSFNFRGTEYAVHPLDMSWPDPDDPAQTTCIGAIQYEPGIGEHGDFILGSSFLKNVYAVFNYPDYNRLSWQPTVGLSSLINASIAAQDFYSVRTLRQSLSSVSANSGALVPGSGTGSSSPSSAATGGSGSSSSKAVVSTGIIIGASVGGILLLAVGAFLAWWFWLRRKWGANGVVQYRDSAISAGGPGSHKSQLSLYETMIRKEKHGHTQRQKSMVEGFSDYEGDSWVSGTEGADSIRLGYLPELQEDSVNPSRPRDSTDRDSFASTARGRSLGRHTSRPSGHMIDLSDDVTASPSGSAANPFDTPRSRSQDFSVSPTRRSRLVPASLLDEAATPTSPVRAGAHPYPTDGPLPLSATQPALSTRGKNKRNVSMSMSGPFPSPMRASVASGELLGSPLQDIRHSDYFGTVPQTEDSDDEAIRRNMAGVGTLGSRTKR